MGILSSNLGEIAFDIDDDSISVLGISVSKRRCGIGSGLVKELEKFAIKQDIKEKEQGKIRDTDSGVIVLEKVLKN